MTYFGLDVHKASIFLRREQHFNIAPHPHGVVQNAPYQRSTATWLIAMPAQSRSLGPSTPTSSLLQHSVRPKG
jgi:hypothetical protein